MKNTLLSVLPSVSVMAFVGLLCAGCSTDTTYETIDLAYVTIEQTGENPPPLQDVVFY